MERLGESSSTGKGVKILSMAKSSISSISMKSSMIGEIVVAVLLVAV